MYSIVKRLRESVHAEEKDKDILEETEEEDAIEESDEFSSRDDMAAILSEEEEESTEEEVLEEGVAEVANRIQNTYANLLVELQTLKKGAGHCGMRTTDDLDPDTVKKWNAANNLVLDKLDDMKSLMKSIRDIVARAKR